MSEYATFLKVGATSILLAMLEDSSTVLRDLTLENPIRAIREISHDITCQRRVRLANGREMRALDIQAEYLERALKFRDTPGASPEEDRALDMWEHCLKGLEADPLSLWRECDWVAKYRLIDEVRKRHDVPLTHPKVAMVDLMYHDVDRSRGLFYKLQRREQVERITTDADIATAMTQPPQTTRARLRGAFVRRAKERRRDFTVDWVHLKLNDQAQRTVLLKDPFKSHDERVERLIASLVGAHRGARRPPVRSGDVPGRTSTTSVDSAPMLSISPVKILIVLVVAMILVGPDKLPQVARQIGGAWRALKSFRGAGGDRGALDHARPALDPGHRPHGPLTGAPLEPARRHVPDRPRRTGARRRCRGATGHRRGHPAARRGRQL